MNHDLLRNRIWGALSWGALCGLRSLTGPALASHHLRGRAARTYWQHRLAKPGVRRTLEALALAELVADKLPFTPPRIAPPGLVARAASGALVGLVSTRPRGSRWRYGAGRARRREVLELCLIGAVAAVTSAHAGYWFRRASRARFGLSTLVGGLMEDAVVVLIASRLSIV